MAALTPEIVCVFTLLWISPVVTVSGDTVNMTEKSGLDVTLPCQASRDASITLLKWTKDNLTDYAFYFRENRLYENYQHPSFRGRVELKDPKMKDGDVSVVLKNIAVNDKGTYQCLIKEKDRPENVTIIKLEVTDSGDTAGREGNKEGGNKDGGNSDEGNKNGGNKNGHVGLIIGLSVVGVGVVVVVVVVGFMIYRKRKVSTENNSY